MSILYLVATPIGNLEDISARALRILGEVSLIAAEDTRRTKKLLSFYQIKTPITSYFEHNKREKIVTILSKLAKGNVALVSDAGTPGLNDPGFELVQAAIQAGHQVSPIPGPCAPIAALISSGLPTDTFLYIGYLPRKTTERKKYLENIQFVPYTLIALETPHRLLKSLQDLLQCLGDRKIAIVRELTKYHEEIYRGTINETIQHYIQYEPRGEITLVIEGDKSNGQNMSEEFLLSFITNELEKGKPPSIIANQLALTSGWKKKEIYRIALQLKIKHQQNSM